MNTANRIFGLEDRYSGFFASFYKNHNEVKKAILSHKNVAQVSLKKEMEGLVKSYQQQMGELINISIGISLVIAALFMLSSMSMNILEREGEYASLESLGFGNKMLTKIVLTEVFAEGIIALILSIPLSTVFAWYLNLKMADAWFKIDLFFNAPDFISVMIAALLLLPVAAIPGLIHIFRLDISLAVRKRGFG